MLHFPLAVLPSGRQLLGRDDQDPAEPVTVALGVGKFPGALRAEVGRPLVRGLPLFPLTVVGQGEKLLPRDGPEGFCPVPRTPGRGLQNRPPVEQAASMSPGKMSLVSPTRMKSPHRAAFLRASIAPTSWLISAAGMGLNGMPPLLVGRQDLSQGVKGGPSHSTDRDGSGGQGVQVPELQAAPRAGGPASAASAATAALRPVVAAHGPLALS